MPIFGLTRYGPSGEMIFVPGDEVYNYVTILATNGSTNFESLRTFNPDYKKLKEFIYAPCS